MKTQRDVLRHILELRKTGKNREADRWLSHPSLSAEARRIFTNCLKEANAAFRFATGSQLPAVLRRTVTKGDIRLFGKRCWDYAGPYQRRTSKMALGAAYVNRQLKRRQFR
jgi:hypothetical protein